MRAHGRGQADTRSEMASLSRTRAMKSWPHSKVVDFLRRITEVMSSPHFLGFHSRPPFFVRSVQKKRKAKPPRRLHVWRNRFSVTQFSRAGHHLLRSFLPSPFNFSSASFRNHRSTTDIVLVLLFALSSLLPTTPLAFVLSSVRLLPTPSGSITAICDSRHRRVVAVRVRAHPKAERKTKGDGPSRPR